MGKLLKRWNCYVVSVHLDSFVCRLSNETNQEEEAELRLGEFTPDERSRIKPGAIFKWFIIQTDTDVTSEFRFPDPWSLDELKEINKEIDELTKLFERGEK